jgi:uncharacterized protein involved in exopolysaccharide biosynthesis
MTPSTSAAVAEPPSILPLLPTIFWQRRWFVILPLMLAVAVGIAVAVLMPPVYESSGTVLIESPQLPSDLVSSPVTDIIDQRIARTRERVLSRTDLIRLIRANGLYEREQRTMPLSKIVDQMRDATVLQAVSADLQAVRGARGNTPDTIAITIGFRYRDPVKAQLVAQQYVSRFLELDATTQSDQAVGAANFLGDQASSIQSQIAAIERRVNDIKAKNGAVFALQGQMTGDPSADAARIDAEIAGLQVQNGSLLRQANSGDSSAGVAAAEQALRAAQARYSDTHPDVIAAKAQLAAAQRASAGAPSSGNDAKAQIQANQQQIVALRNAKAMMLSQGSAARSAASKAPVLSAQVDQLEKQADTLRDQYREIGNKLQTAQVSARMQTEQKGERLVLADPPVIPDHPARPNRPLIILGSVVGGLVAGLGLALLIELMLRPMRGTEAVTYAVGEAPLVVIPDFSRRTNPIIRFIEQRRRRRNAPAPIA